MFSLAPRCQGECGSQKHALTPVASAKERWAAISQPWSQVGVLASAAGTAATISAGREATAWLAWASRRDTRDSLDDLSTRVARQLRPSDPTTRSPSRWPGTARPSAPAGRAGPVPRAQGLLDLELLAQRALPLRVERPVDGLVAHAHPLLAREVLPHPARDLLGRPAPREPGDHVGPDARVVDLAGLGPQGGRLGGALRRAGVAGAVVPAVPADLPGHRRAVEADDGGDARDCLTDRARVAGTSSRTRCRHRERRALRAARNPGGGPRGVRAHRCGSRRRGHPQARGLVWRCRPPTLRQNFASAP